MRAWFLIFVYLVGIGVVSGELLPSAKNVQDLPQKSPQELVDELRQLNYPRCEGFSLASDYYKKFNQACAVGDATTLLQLIDIFEGTLQQKGLRLANIMENLFPPLADLSLKLWAAKNQTAPTDIQKFALPEAIPESIAKLPSEFIKDWQQYTSLQSASPKPKENTPPSQNFYLDDPVPFWNFAISLLRGEKRDSPWYDGVNSITSGMSFVDWYGTFEPCKAYLFLLAAIADNNIVGALPAAFSIPLNKNESMLGAEKAIVTLARICGAEWRQLAFGSLIPSTERGFARNNVAVTMLTRHGDSKDARKLLSLAQIVPSQYQQYYIQALAVFLKKKKEYLGTTSTKKFRTSRFYQPEVGFNPADDDTQQLIIEWFEKLVSEKNLVPFKTTAIMQAVQELPLADIKPLLLLLLAHPSAQVAKDAARELTERGEKTEAPPKKPPMRFRLTANGEPVAQEKIRYSFSYKRNANSSGGSFGSSGKTNDEGILEIERDRFMDTEEILTKITLDNNNATNEIQKITDTYFHIVLPMPDMESESIIQVPLKTRPVTLNISFPFSDIEGKEIKISTSGNMFSSNSICHFKVPATRKMIFPRVQGTLKLTIVSSGIADWQGEVEGDSANIELKAARDVHFRLKFSTEISQAQLHRFYGAVKIELEKNDWRKTQPQADINEGIIFYAIPLGNYEVVFPSSQKLSQHRNFLPDDMEFPEIRFPFTLTKDSPPVVDLGEITIH